MSDENGIGRRSVLAGMAMGLSGCGSLLEPDEKDVDDSTDTPGQTDRPTDSPTETERPEIDGQEYGNRGLSNTNYDSLLNSFRNLEETRLENNFFLSSAIDSEGGWPYESGGGVQATDEIVLAARDESDQNVSIIDNQDDATFRWYAKEIPRVAHDFSSILSQLQDEGIQNLQDEELGDPLDTGQPSSEFRTYLQAASNDLKQIAPFIKLNPETNNPIISDEVLSDFRTKRNQVRNLKEDYRSLVIGNNSIQDLTERVTPENYTSGAVKKSEELYDAALARYGGLMLLEEVYTEASQSLTAAQDLLDGGKYNEKGNSRDDGNGNDNGNGNDDNGNDDDINNGDDDNGNGNDDDGNGTRWRDFSATYDHMGGIQVRLQEILEDQGVEGLYDTFARFIDREDEYREELLPEEDIERVENGKRIRKETLKKFYDQFTSKPEGNITTFEFEGRIKGVPENYDNPDKPFNVDLDSLNYLVTQATTDGPDNFIEVEQNENKGTGYFDEDVFEYFIDRNLEFEIEE